MSLGSRIFQREKLDRYLETDKKFIKTMSAVDLISLGIGAVIGTGIFILPGTVAATKAGPGIILSFIVAAIVCSTSAMCYAEFASALPVAGSAYSYGNLVFGEVIGWVLGWALILEYVLAVAAVSSAWGAYFQSFLKGFHINFPTAISGPFNPAGGTYGNVIAIIIVLLISWMLSYGMRSSTRVNNTIVFVKIGIILLFIVVGLFYVKPSNWHPFLPYGWIGGHGGVFGGAAAVFFAYLGFDAVSSSAAEVKDPKKNMPIGIIGTLIVATVLYVGVSIVLTGMVSYTKLDVADPVAFALQFVQLNWVAGIISIGALAGMFTMMVTMIYSSSRLIYSIGRDGLLPQFLGKLDKRGNPRNSLTIVTVIIAIMGGFVPLDQLTNLVNIGTLIAFLFVSYGIIPLRHNKEIQNNHGYQVPFYPVLPIVSVLLCLFMLSQLQAETWIASGIWFAIGLVIYFSYGMWHSKINKDRTEA
ncbi:amino acid permease [Lentilactobacillus parafarraginis]|jgi:APA family basic amino acid/polyamine antiporter|uniref:APC family amino acid-polyamine-organocation transporter n=3 Tax=Lentilactobacillus parafarraginis TaxID=390842 RepID=A0A0R1YNC5_9LACO|nr:amino acid permease [Lentilactobacillus parafarraginis]KRM43713.1 APC family amino acid-polyamine-organocation transporter [Lentilactobacillus parafarraginis DSM 18390 = JCM 14109]TLQ16637.1 amino acid permease [Lentilactobacillus parafarraginis]